METETIIIVSVLSAAWVVMAVVGAVLCSRVASLRRQLDDLNASGRLRIQKLTMSSDKHAFNNPTICPEEELSRRGYSMYQPDDDAESGRGTERYSPPSTHSPPAPPPHRMQAYHTQTGGQLVDELAREIDNRQQRQSALQQQQQQQRSMPQPQQQPQQQHSNSTPQQNPPFLLQSIENSKKIRALANPVAAQGRQSDTNPNFMY